MPQKSFETLKLHQMARYFREAADETCYPGYFRKMIQTAEDLDALAATLENMSDPESRSDATE